MEMTRGKSSNRRLYSKSLFRCPEFRDHYTPPEDALMKRLSITLAFIALCSASAQAQTNDIRKIDFLNFTYQPACIGGGEKIQARNGEYSLGSADDPSSDRVYFKVMDVVYGDLTGDGQTEAVVTTLCNTGGTGQFTDGIIFTLRGGRATAIGTLGMGDRADGGIDSVAIERGLIRVSRYGTESGGACCPEYIETQAYRLTGSRLVEVGKPVRKRIEQDDPSDNSAKRIRFARGRTTAVVEGLTEATDEYVLGARAGQTMIVHVTSRENNAVIKVLDSSGNPVRGNAKPNDWTGTLPGSGDYKILVSSIRGTADYTLEVTIR